MLFNHGVPPVMAAFHQVDARSDADVGRLAQAAAYEVPEHYFELAGTPQRLRDFMLEEDLPGYLHDNHLGDSLAMKLRRIGEGVWHHAGTAWVEDSEGEDDADEAAAAAAGDEAF